MRLAALAGIRVFVTGGLGGVHRGAETLLRHLRRPHRARPDRRRRRVGRGEVDPRHRAHPGDARDPRGAGRRLRHRRVPVVLLPLAAATRRPDARRLGRGAGRDDAGQVGPRPRTAASPSPTRSRSRTRSRPTRSASSSTRRSPSATSAASTARTSRRSCSGASSSCPRAARSTPTSPWCATTPASARRSPSPTRRLVYVQVCRVVTTRHTVQPAGRSPTGGARGG